MPRPPSRSPTRSQQRPVRRVHTFPSPYADTLFDAHLEWVYEDGGDLVFDLRTLQLDAPPAPQMISGQPYELVRGRHIAQRLRFPQASLAQRSGPFAEVNTLAPHHDARRVFGFQHLLAPSWGEIFVLSSAFAEDGLLVVRGHECLLEARNETPQPVEYLRRWKATPPPIIGPNSHRPVLYRRYGGDPIPIRLGRRVYRQRLFVGGIGLQGEQRPAVDAVLNLCEEPNPWRMRDGVYLADRLACKGELGQGMRADDLRAEAEWVVERLRNGRRVLVHCVAGINRSSSVACATLMLLEGLTPEQALTRVRSGRPQVAPDPYHWFALARLAEALGILPTPPAVDCPVSCDGDAIPSLPLAEEALATYRA